MPATAELAEQRVRASGVIMIARIGERRVGDRLVVRHPQSRRERETLASEANRSTLSAGPQCENASECRGRGGRNGERAREPREIGDGHARRCDRRRIPGTDEL